MLTSPCDRCDGSWVRMASNDAGSAHLRGLLTELRCEALRTLRRAALRILQLPILERHLRMREPRSQLAALSQAFACPRLTVPKHVTATWRQGEQGTSRLRELWTVQTNQSMKFLHLSEPTET